MFTATISFKRSEPTPFSYQDTVDLKTQYASAITGKESEPMLHPNAPSQDSDWFRHDYLPQHPAHYNPIAGLHLRKADMSAYNKHRAPIDRRQLTFYTLRGSLPPPFFPSASTSSTTSPPSTSSPTNLGNAKTPLTPTRAANLHACAHLYASDRNSLYIIPNHLSLPRAYTRMASLSHTVIFHVGIRELVLPDEPRIRHPNADPTAWEEGPVPVCNLDHGGEDGEERGKGNGEEGKTDRDADGRKWFVQESWVTRANEGRGLHMSRLWDWERGVHIATTIQDGLLRFRPDAEMPGDKKGDANAKL
jgi:hypothetical protein